MWHAVRERFWVLPAAAIVVAVAAGLLVPRLDAHVALPESVAFTGQEDSARAVLATIATIAVSVAGVSFSVIAVALVLASQQLSPRVLRSFQRQPLNQGVLALLLGTATYALFVLTSVSDADGEPVGELAVTLAMLLAAASLALFVLFLHHAVRSLNASVVIRRIAAEGHQTVAEPYPEGVGRPVTGERAERVAEEWQARGACAEVRASRAGYVAAVDGAAILRWAASHDAFVEQRRGVGAFAVTGALLAVVRFAGERAADVAPVVEAFRLREERVVDGDIAFPVRQLADIALKGLSPSVNDPTTSENAMDSVTDTLVRFAAREPVAPVRMDEVGVPRLRAIAPTLDALVLLGFDQVRRDAADRPSFAVRLLELLADLRDSGARAAACDEIPRQARLTADQAATRADEQADQALVTDAFERLHGTVVADPGAARRHRSAA